MNGFLKALLPLSVLLITACAGTPEENEPAELTDFVIERELDRLWATTVGEGQGKGLYQLRPVVEGDTLYVVSADGVLQAHDALSGKQRWKRKLELTISGGVGIDDERLFLGTTEGLVLALDQEGAELWRAKVNGEVLAPPVSNDDIVVVQTYDGQLVAFDAGNGEKRWTYTASVPRLTLRGTSTPVLDGQFVFAGLANGRIVALDEKTGELRWEQRVSVAKGSTEIERLSDVDGSLLLDSGVIYAAGYQGKLIAVEARSGRRMWERDLSSHTGPVEGYGNVYVADAEGSIHAFEKNGQGVIWTQTILSRRKLTEPAILSGSLVVGDFEGYLHFVSQVDGHLVSRVQVDDSGMRAPMLVNEDRLYAFSNAGTLVAYSFDRSGSTSSKRSFGPRQLR
ncbi:MAG TPA: outer membrane protein assembly factor BamB [Spongiibacteraceae bacterium]|nr:outer membrane protein assembly factor BamB [Spongiibacteraceae bacterium]MBN48452.1 outer membrane protein assembly factor BamB [Spongiibacteraceae bacterium]HCS26513.1 outer membrane protein assembly factor BamB [Spongiibacteraceae bacterium]